MPLVRDEELVRIELPADGEYAMVKPRPSAAERNRMNGMIQAVTLKARMAAERGEARNRAERRQNGASAEDEASLEFDIPLAAEDIARADYYGLQLAVKELHVSPGSGRPVEKIENPPMELLEELDEESFKTLVDAINELWAERTEEERRNLSSAPATPSRESKEPASQTS